VKDTTKCNCHTPLAPTPTFDNTHTYISLSPLLSESYAENTVQLDAELQVNSNSVLTTFAASFLFNKTITDDNKKASLLFGGKQLKYQDELKTGITYKHYFKKSGVGIYVSYYHRNTRSLVTTRDAFELLFYGNKKFEDKTADLSNIHFENMMYNQYSIGISKSDGHFYIGANLSFLQGFNDQQLTNTKGGLYTATYGEYLDLSYNMTFNQSNTDASKFFDLNGTGFSADLQLGYNTERSRFSFTVQDLGSISWNKKAINYTGDTTIHYDGIAFNNITNITGGGLSGINLDSTINALVPSKTAKSYSTFLPATIQFTYSRLFKLKKHSMILTAGINTKILPNYYAYGFVKTTFLLGQNWSTGVSAGGGGYSLFNLGVDVGKKWRNLDFILGTSNLIGSILPMYYPGSSVYLRVAAHF
jgi:hypothetical protein